MILLVGKTASGKDTLQKELIKLGYKAVVSYTTRPPRAGEVDGIAYHFITKEDFLSKDKDGFFAETTSYNVATGETWYYGSAIKDLTDDKVMIVNPDETLWNRLRQRGDDAAEARRRLNADDTDFAGIVSDVEFCLKNDLGISPSVMARFIHETYVATKGE